MPGQVLDPGAVANVELQMLDSLELHRDVVRAQLGPPPHRRRSTRRWRNSSRTCTSPRRTKRTSSS
ncbi:hypothetical protein MOP88_17055 [Sphingomonas sp. WKB10]|nr:hypothetical protein [Sphingomonas sp. WKB10]